MMTPTPHLEFTDDPTGKWSRSVARGDAARLAPGIYTTDVDTPLEKQVRQDIWRVVAHEFPDAVVTDRTAQNPTWKPDDPIFVFLAHPHRRRIVALPGATIVARSGSGPLDGDPPFRDGTRIAAEPRALLENARKGQASGGRPPSTLTRDELADWIAQLVISRGRDRINRLRDQMRSLADELDLESERQIVDRLIGAALGTLPVPPKASAAIGALHGGRGFDQRRVDLFDDVAGQLSAIDPPQRDAMKSPDETPFAFFESYFSNFIEGTEFTVEEAQRIIFEGEDPRDRPAGDAHDIRATFALASDPVDRQATPQSLDEFIELLASRHRALMGGRPEQRPGEFKLGDNQAGGYVFVQHDLVQGTLEHAYTRSLAVPPGFARAVFMLFAVAEVHPFQDGNGRLARLFANAELSNGDQSRLIVPTVFRYEYFNALRLTSNAGTIAALVRVCDFAQLWADRVDFTTFESAGRDLERSNAFIDPANDENARLELP